MLTKYAGKSVVGWFVVVAATAVLVAPRAQAQASSAAENMTQESALNGLAEQLNGTGRFATMQVTKLSSIAPADDSRDSRNEARVRAGGADSSAQNVSSATVAPAMEFHYRKALGAVENCRFDVARRRSMVPHDVAAGTVTLRWTIEPSGAVRDAEVITVSGTDAEVAACAKRVLAGWHFIKPLQGPVTLERAYTFRTLP
jgi:hypothetical protein